MSSEPNNSVGKNEAASAALPFFLALAVLFALVYGGWKWWQVRQFELSRGQAIDASMVGSPLTEFELIERSGKPFRSADMKGKVWVATYFFTTCPGSCLRLNERIQAMHNLRELKDVTWVSITCDPDNDTPEVLSAYADRWNADPKRWLFCRADLDYTRRVALGMDLFLSLKGHQDHAAVIDKTGKIRGMFDATSEIECDRMRKLLVELLEEKPPQDLAAKSAGKKKSS